MQLIAIFFHLVAIQPSILSQYLPNEPIYLPRINGEIVIDGRVDEQVWVEIEPFPIVTYTPVAGLPPSEKTEIRVGYDDNYIYASIRAWDSDPSGIRINSLYRDRLSGDDHFHFLLDTFNDNETAMVFVVSPSGAKRDMLVANDGEGSNAVNSDFTTFWDVETHVDEHGWYAEMRIPFTSLGFQDENGRVEMGLYVQRGISRKNERVSFPPAPDHLARAFFRPSIAQKVVFEGIYSQRSLYITPYITGGLDQQSLLHEDQSEYQIDKSRSLEGGFDIRYGITNNLTLDLTINTDFAQIEADDQQVNLTRFNLFFPEKRQFFLDRAGMFDFYTGDNERLFHSRRIGLTSEGETIRILGGGRLYGRLGSWDVGVLNMQTESRLGNPGENFGVMRLRREIVNPYSYAGAMLTSRIEMDGSHNLAYGVDGSIRLRNNDYASWALAQTIDEGSEEFSFFSSTRMTALWERRTLRGFSWRSSMSLSGEDFNPQIGFIRRHNYYKVAQTLKYGWLHGVGSWLQSHSVELDGDFYWRLTDHLFESSEQSLIWSGTNMSGDQMQLGIKRVFENIPETFKILGLANIEPDDYTFLRAKASYSMAYGRLLRTGVNLEAGSFYNGWGAMFEIAPIWNISKHLELQGGWQYNLIDLPSIDRISSHLGQLRIRTALNTKLSTNAFIQFNSSAHIVYSNIRFRYNFRDGNDFWIVLNDGMNTDRYRMETILPRTNARTLMVKYTYTIHGSH